MDGVRVRRGMMRLRRLWRRPWQDKWLLIQVYLLLGCARLVLNAVPFRRLAATVGPLHTETPFEIAPAHLLAAQRIAWAIQRASPYTPWQSNCFPQALAAKFLLRRYGIPSTLYLGAAFTPDKTGMEAHAWLRCGPLFVTGGPGHERFGVVGIFG